MADSDLIRNLVGSELDKLFATLRSANDAVVTPTPDLARLTLINVVDQAVQRRASTIVAPMSGLTDGVEQGSTLADLVENGDEAVLERTESPLSLIHI